MGLGQVLSEGPIHNLQQHDVLAFSIGLRRTCWRAGVLACVHKQRARKRPAQRGGLHFVAAARPPRAHPAQLLACCCCVTPVCTQNTQRPAPCTHLPQLADRAVQLLGSRRHPGRRLTRRQLRSQLLQHLCRVLARIAAHQPQPRLVQGLRARQRGEGGEQEARSARLVPPSTVKHLAAAARGVSKLTHTPRMPTGRVRGQAVTAPTVAWLACSMPSMAPALAAAHAFCFCATRSASFSATSTSAAACAAAAAAAAMAEGAPGPVCRLPMLPPAAAGGTGGVWRGRAERGRAASFSLLGAPTVRWPL